LTYFSALLVVNKKAFDKLSEEDRQTVRDLMGRAFIRIDQQNRKDNIEAKEALKNQGIKFEQLSPASKEEWRKIGETAIKQLEKQNKYSDKAYSDLMKYLDESKQVRP
jgi:TRAP-type C4-dicarboxylate transport system substrate-binding protein